MRIKIIIIIIDCRKEEDEANFPNDKKIICFLCRKWSHRHCTGEEEYCLTYVWACRYCRGIAENTSHIHTIISDLKQTITGVTAQSIPSDQTTPGYKIG